MYETDQEIAFDEFISSEFLRAMKLYYEEYEYNPEKLKVYILTIQILHSKTPNTTAENTIMEPFLKKAQ